MLDFSFTEMAVIGAVALIVIGPEKLPKVAHTLGRYAAKIQKQIHGIKNEINRAVEIDNLKKMKQDLEQSARDIEASTRDLEKKIAKEAQSIQQHIGDDFGQDDWHDDEYPNALDERTSGFDSTHGPTVPYQPIRKNWRSKRAAVPHWYRKRHGLRSQVQSASARVARHRPKKH